MNKDKIISDELIEKIRKTSYENNLSDESTKTLFDVIEQFANQETINLTLAQRIGQYFYYYSQIDEILTRIINSLLPELNLTILGIESSLDGNSFRKKIELIKSLTPNASELKIFPLLEKLNSIRNKLAHTSPKNLDLSKTNKELLSIFKESFVINDEIFDKLSKSVASNDEISIPVKVILVTKMFLELFANIENLGKREDKQLRIFESVRKFSSLYVRRRFSILAFQMQTRTLSGDAPKHFKQEKAFEDIINELKESILSLLGKNASGD